MNREADSAAAFLDAGPAAVGNSDAAVALIMAIGRSVTEPEQFTSIFERAELWQA
ncbi:hypothetical protein [Belnapia sp. F-4-1]|uniref:hypothetical protein n=1 Tax=Belnapia sp. F-4-1 TaxID=1545443 RepID=UPI001364AF34|nr:hypothetical protein [Belnapia sp. F-4-1]